MGIVDLAVLALLATAVVFSIIELGLSAHAVDVTSDFYYKTNDRYSYLVFCSVWTLLVTAFLIAFPFVSRRNSSNQAAHHERWLTPLTLVLNTVTMIFWLAGFAALADLYGDYSPHGEPGALLAFAVMLWLIFLAILIVNILTAVGVVKSERPGHTILTAQKPVTNGA